jgi:hypothetical protein
MGHRVGERLAAVALTATCVACRDVVAPPPPERILPEDRATAHLYAPPFDDDPACAMFEWPMSPDLATEMLTKTTLLGDSGWHEPGVVVPSFAAFAVLVRQPDALARFDRVAAEAGPAGRLYALLAFQRLDRARFDALGAKLRNDASRVEILEGCLRSTETVSALARTVDDGAWSQPFREPRGADTVAVYRTPWPCGKDRAVPTE